MVDLGSIHSVFKMAPHASVALLPDSPRYTIAEVNEAFLAETFVDRSIIGRSFFEIFSQDRTDNEEQTKCIVEAFEHVIKSKTAHQIPLYSYDLYTVEYGHDVHHWTLDTYPVLDEANNVQYIVQSVRNITEAQQASDLKQLEHEVLELNSKKNADIKEVLMVYLQGIEHILPNVRCSIMKVAHDRLYNLVSPVLPRDYLDYIDGGEIGPASGSCGTAAFTKKMVAIPDIQSDPRWQDYKELAQTYNLVACSSHPIMDTELKVMAVLSVYYSVSRAPRADEIKTIERVVALLEVIMENRQNAKNLGDKNELHTYVNKATNDAIYDWDIIGNRIKWSDGFNRILGFEVEQDDYGIEKWALRLHPKDALMVKEDLGQAILDSCQSNWSSEYRFRRKDGTYAFIEENGYIIRDASGKARRMIGVLRDITRLREIAWAQTHLVREPLTRIMGIATLLCDGSEDCHNDRALLDYLDASAKELDQIVKDIVNKSIERI